MSSWRWEEMALCTSGNSKWCSYTSRLLYGRHCGNDFRSDMNQWFYLYIYVILSILMNEIIYTLYMYINKKEKKIVTGRFTFVLLVTTPHKGWNRMKTKRKLGWQAPWVYFRMSRFRPSPLTPWTGVQTRKGFVCAQHLTRQWGSLLWLS